MGDKLSILNFGPIKEAELDVKDMMIFIGAQSSGKSTLAKLITILNDFNFRQNNVSLEEELEKYNLHSFIKKSTVIKFNSQFFRFKYAKGKETKFDPLKFLNHYQEKKNLEKSDLERIELILSLMISSIFLDGKSSILLREIQKDDNFGFIDGQESITDTDFYIDSNITDLVINVLRLYNKKPVIEELNNLAKNVVRVFSFIRPLDSMYIPAERTLIPLIVNNIAGLINNKIALPNYVLQAVQEFEKGLNNIKELDLKIIGGLRFKRKGDLSFIYHNQNQKVLLRESSSGVQSILPILLLVESSLKKENYINLNYVVEEPELNLYPKAQYDLTKYLVKSCLETDRKVMAKNLIITTHSPYILASANNLLLAHKKGIVNSSKAEKIVSKSSWINPTNFNAYEVKKGKVYRIFNKKSKLIDDNIIEEVSDLIMQDFKSLAIIND